MSGFYQGRVIQGCQPQDVIESYFLSEGYENESKIWTDPDDYSN